MFFFAVFYSMHSVVWLIYSLFFSFVILFLIYIDWCNLLIHPLLFLTVGTHILGGVTICTTWWNSFSRFFFCSFFSFVTFFNIRRLIWFCSLSAVFLRWGVKFWINFFCISILHLVFQRKFSTSALPDCPGSRHLTKARQTRQARPISARTRRSRSHDPPPRETGILPSAPRARATRSTQTHGRHPVDVVESKSVDASYEERPEDGPPSATLHAWTSDRRLANNPRNYKLLPRWVITPPGNPLQIHSQICCAYVL